ncbi:hypothetical protein [Chengkuizengella sediminis]|uniref:hypothetical protein n=1 Tax=Chengkuizengella sediminis TaxID=1885917 RepID=UPI0013893D1F|nr:hypothetical protein [Chengkuizengella sediminis]NDI37258.1 hypothetical protein [Chengkuizengella sediminis]
MKKIIIKGLIIISIILTTIGLIDYNYTSYSEISDDYYAYSVPINDEIELLELYESLNGEMNHDNNAFYNSFTQQIIPKYKDYITLVEALDSPKTEEVRKAHEIYINAINARYSAFILLQQALEDQNSELKNQANEKLIEAEDLMNNYNEAMRSLAAYYGPG